MLLSCFRHAQLYHGATKFCFTPFQVKAPYQLPVPPCVTKNALVNQNLGKPPHRQQRPPKHTVCTGSASHPGNSLICIAVEQIHPQQKQGNLPLEQRVEN